METKGLGAGSYPDAPKELEMQTVELECNFKTYIQVPADYSYDEMFEYINTNYNNFDLIEEADKIEINDINRLN